jgi:putative ABC transport system substrate-binding protein
LIKGATKTVAELALKHGLPAGAQTRSLAEVGGLISYGADGPQVFRQSTRFVSKILQGGNRADMPIEQPTKFELVVNLRAAKRARDNGSGIIPAACRPGN